MIIKEYPKDTLVSDRKVGQCRKAIPLLFFLLYSFRAAIGGSPD